MNSEALRWRIHRFFKKARKCAHPSFVYQRIRRMRGDSKKGLTSINLSLSARCSADCIFCPLTKDQVFEKDFMPFEYIEKIINELTSSTFKKRHNIEVISVGENGDVFLHKDAVDILRYIRKRMPYVKIVVYTNFRMFTPEKIDAVIKEDLLDFIGCNIDGSSAENYFRVKKTDFDKVMKHLRYFMAVRKKICRDIPILIENLTYYNYVKAVYSHLGVLPKKVKSCDFNNVKDDYAEIEKLIRPLLSHPKDRFLRTVPIAWAEREASRVEDHAQYTCPILDRIKKEAFITPSGIWYACCFDAYAELILGNVIKDSIQTIYESKKRVELINRLENKKFVEIGSPCAAIDCCQRIFDREEKCQ
ncbi:radical SAM/SPASM domain-containing protein [Candidatus Omnitrophota bacterium]